MTVAALAAAEALISVSASEIFSSSSSEPCFPSLLLAEMVESRLWLRVRGVCMVATGAVCGAWRTIGCVTGVVYRFEELFGVLGREERDCTPRECLARSLTGLACIGVQGAVLCS